MDISFKNLLKNFILTVIVILLACISIVIVVDPFFHYHKPILGLKAVLSEKEYQCIGTIKNFDYDALIVGSSVCENYNNHWFDDKFDCNSIKAVRSYGATADLCYFVNEAYKDHNLKYVFYNIDPTSLAAKPYLTFEETGCPMYLYDSNPLNDVEYLLNKDVLIEKIPYMITKSFIGEYDEGNSFSWGQWKEFHADMVTGLYIRSHSIKEMKDDKFYEDECNSNIEMIESIVSKHPETKFYFFYPPYSFVWWDGVYRDGDLNAYIHNMKQCTLRLMKYSNVEFYSFITDEEIVTDLDNYMDVLHFSPDINHRIVEKLGGNEYVIDSEHIEDMADNMYSFAIRVEDELIIPYLDIIKVQPNDDEDS